MKRFMAIALLLAACERGSGTGSELDRKFKSARQTIKPGDAWSEATAAADQQLGPAKIKDDTEWRWATLDGDHCYDLRLMRNAGGNKVTGVTGGHVNSVVEDRFARCKDIARKTP